MHPQPTGQPSNPSTQHVSKADERYCPAQEKQLTLAQALQNNQHLFLRL